MVVPTAALHAALRAAVLKKTDCDPAELDREVAAAVAEPQSRQSRARCFFCDSLIDTRCGLSFNGLVSIRGGLQLSRSLQRFSGCPVLGR